MQNTSRPRPPAGIVTVTSPHRFDETVDRLVGAVHHAGLTLFTVVDHAGGARAAGLEMHPAKLLVLGDPAAGTPAMIASPEMGLELPLRLLVWEDDRHEVLVSRQDTSEWGDRFGVRADVLAPLSRVAALVDRALAPERGPSIA